MLATEKTCTVQKSAVYCSHNKHTMRIRITYSIEVEFDDSNAIGLKEVTKDFNVKESFNGAYLLDNGWFVDYKYSPESEWEIYRGEEYISLCSRPIELTPTAE